MKEPSNCITQSERKQRSPYSDHHVASSRLQVGQTFDSYEDLCLYLSEPVATGGALITQRKHFSRYFKWEKKNHKFIITEVTPYYPPYPGLYNLNLGATYNLLDEVLPLLNLQSSITESSFGELSSLLRDISRYVLWDVVSEETVIPTEVLKYPLCKTNVTNELPSGLLKQRRAIIEEFKKKEKELNKKKEKEEKLLQKAIEAEERRIKNSLITKYAKTRAQSLGYLSLSYITLFATLLNHISSKEKFHVTANNLFISLCLINPKFYSEEAQSVFAKKLKIDKKILGDLIHAVYVAIADVRNSTVDSLKEKEILREWNLDDIVTNLEGKKTPMSKGQQLYYKRFQFDSCKQLGCINVTDVYKKHLGKEYKASLQKKIAIMKWAGVEKGYQIIKGRKIGYYQINLPDAQWSANCKFVKTLKPRLYRLSLSSLSSFSDDAKIYIIDSFIDTFVKIEKPAGVTLGVASNSGQDEMPITTPIVPTIEYVDEDSYSIDKNVVVDVMGIVTTDNNDLIDMATT